VVSFGEKRVDERCSSGDKKGVGVRVEEQRKKEQ